MPTFLSRMRTAVQPAVVVAVIGAVGCSPSSETTGSQRPGTKPDFVLRDDQTHHKCSRRIPPALRVPSGSIVEAFAREATGGQFDIESSDPTAVNMDLVHTLTARSMWKAPNPEILSRSSCSRSKSATAWGVP